MGLLEFSYPSFYSPLLQTGYDQQDIPQASDCLADFERLFDVCTPMKHRQLKPPQQLSQVHDSPFHGHTWDGMCNFLAAIPYSTIFFSINYF